MLLLYVDDMLIVWSNMKEIVISKSVWQKNSQWRTWVLRGKYWKLRIN